MIQVFTKSELVQRTESCRHQEKEPWRISIVERKRHKLNQKLVFYKSTKLPMIPLSWIDKEGNTIEKQILLI